MVTTYKCVDRIFENPLKIAKKLSISKLRFSQRTEMVMANPGSDPRFIESQVDACTEKAPVCSLSDRCCQILVTQILLDKKINQSDDFNPFHRGC